MLFVLSDPDLTPVSSLHMKNKIISKDRDGKKINTILSMSCILALFSTIFFKSHSLLAAKSCFKFRCL